MQAYQIDTETPTKLKSSTSAVSLARTPGSTFPLWRRDNVSRARRGQRRLVGPTIVSSAALLIIVVAS